VRYELVVLAPIFAAIFSAVLTRHLCKPGPFFYLLDHPNDRSLHTHPTPRTGGVAILAAVLAGGAGIVFVTGAKETVFGWLLIALGTVAIVSYMDDRKHLAPGTRIVAHVSAAAILVQGGFFIGSEIWPGGYESLPTVAVVAISVLYIVWMLNLYNFMDGMDGFAGGMTVIGFGFFAALGWRADHMLFSSLSMVVAAACAGFLLFNFPPARIFMGDTGSSTLGLLAAAFSLWGAQERIFPFWAALLIFSPFIVDATVTLLRRVARRERIWEAHKTHYYQRLVQLGWGHRRTVLSEYVLMGVCGTSAFIGARAATAVQWVIIGFWVITYFATAMVIDHLESRCKK